MQRCLSDPAHRRSVYEQVLREGTAEDIRLLVNREHLLELWHELYLPAHIQAAWSELLRECELFQPSLQSGSDPPVPSYRGELLHPEDRLLLDGVRSRVVPHVIGLLTIR